MNARWFANKGQIVQTVAAITSACVALVSLYFVLKSNNSLPKASAAMYSSGAIFLLLTGFLIGRRSRSAASRSVATLEAKPDSQTVTATSGGARASGGNVNLYMHAPPAAPAVQKDAPIPQMEFVQQDRTRIGNSDRMLRVEDSGAHLVTAMFRNRRLGVGQATPTAYQIHAQLTYRSTNHKETCVHYGHWIGQYTHFAEIGPGESQKVVVALVKEGQTYTLENRNSFDPRKRRIRSGVTVLHAPHTVELPADAYSVEIALVSGETTLYEHTFVITKEPDGAPRLTE